MNFKKIGLVLGLVLLVALFVLLKPLPLEEESREFELTIKDKKLVPSTMKVNEGDNVTFKVNSDEKGLLHLHGYDIEKEVNPGEVTILSFKADITGTFDIELHKQDAHEHEEEEDIVIGTLQVNPRV